jgi:hypothetical protein
MTTRKTQALAAIGLVLALAAGSIGRAEEAADPVAVLDVPRMTDDQIAVAAENLRKEGPAGLDRAQQAYFGWLIGCTSAGGDPTRHAKQDPRWRRLIDLTAQQKDADVSRLFWYTDWELAQAEAQRTDKPVLRLFMMGRLTDNLSCANSRFFRVALYGNQAISSLLRENYILCWTSVRPVPVITVDYGDGRKLERTVTGNSIHYLVNAEGQFIDAMPGLVSPQTFEKWLRDGLDRHTKIASLPEPIKSKRLRTEFENQLGDTLASWRRTLDQIAAERMPTPPTAAPQQNLPEAEAVAIVPTPDVAVTPTAVEAAPRAASKAIVELPLVEHVVNATDVPKSLPPEGPAPTLPPLPNGASGYGPPGALAPPAALSPLTVPASTAVEAAPISTSKYKVEFPLVNSVVVNSVAAASAPVTPAEADAAAPRLIAEALRALPIATSKTGVERPLVRIVVGRDDVPRLIAETTEQDWDRIAETFLAGSRLDESSKGLMNRLHTDPEARTDETCPTSTIESFERSIALDTARNLYLHRRTILEWIVDEGLPTDLVAFNERVYGQLFLTPSSDPWIGLVPADVFTGIEGEGLFGN